MHYIFYFYNIISSGDFIDIRITIDTCSLEVFRIYLEGPKRTDTVLRYPGASDIH